jgi:hypothetical protein
MARGSLIFMAAIGCAGLLSSCGDRSLAGGTSETTNGFTAVVRTTGGTPVSHALVRLRPEGYLSDTAQASVSYDPASIVDTFTDANGRFAIKGIDTGAYSIEIQDGMGGGAIMRAGATESGVVDCGAAVVMAAGSIRGAVDMKRMGDGVAVYVRVYGMERMVRASPENGAFILHDIPQGTHEVNFIARFGEGLFFPLPGLAPLEDHRFQYHGLGSGCPGERRRVPGACPPAFRKFQFQPGREKRRGPAVREIRQHAASL